MKGRREKERDRGIHGEKLNLKKHIGQIWKQKWLKLEIRRYYSAVSSQLYFHLVILLCCSSIVALCKPSKCNKKLIAGKHLVSNKKPHAQDFVQDFAQGSDFIRKLSLSWLIWDCNWNALMQMFWVCRRQKNGDHVCSKQLYDLNQAWVPQNSCFYKFTSYSDESISSPRQQQHVFLITSLVVQQCQTWHEIYEVWKRGMEHTRIPQQ